MCVEENLVSVALNWQNSECDVVSLQIKIPDKIALIEP